MSSETTPRITFRTGKRVALRPFQPEDAALLTKWINDPEVTKYIKRSFPTTLMQEADWVKTLGQNSKENVVLGIELIDGALIGSMGLHRISWINRTATSGAFIGEPAYRGKGYGTEAKMLLLEYAFNTLNLRKVCSTVPAFNGRSQRYNEKCGYGIEGVQREQIFRNGTYHDLIHMAVFREQWLPLWEVYQKQ